MWAAVPVKRFSQVKFRLTPALTDQERANLSQCMLTDVLGGLRRVPGVTRLVVISCEPRIESLLKEFNAQRIEDPEEAGLSAAMTHAARWFKSQRQRHLMYIPSDVPALAPAPLQAFMDAHHSGVSIVRAARENGTNGLICSPPDVIPFAFGVDSGDRHRRAATAAGLATRHCVVAGLERDLDTVEDLRWLMDAAVPCRTRAFLERSGIAQRIVCPETGRV